MEAVCEGAENLDRGRGGESVRSENLLIMPYPALVDAVNPESSPESGLKPDPQSLPEADAGINPDIGQIDR